MNTKQTQQLKTAVDQKIVRNQHQLDANRAEQIVEQSELAKTAEENIEEGKSYGQKDVHQHMLDALKNKFSKPKNE